MRSPKYRPKSKPVSQPAHWLGVAVREATTKNPNGVYATLASLGISYVSYYRITAGRTQFKTLTLVERLLRAAGMRLLVVNADNEIVFKAPDENQ